MEKTISAKFYFYGDIHRFLPKGQRAKKAPHPIFFMVKGHPAVKDSIEALGFPHTEVDWIVVNGCSVGFYYHLQEGDRVKVYADRKMVGLKKV